MEAVVVDLPAERPTSRPAAPAGLMIAQHLAGRTALVEVVEPEAVKAELVRIGPELTARYAN